MRFKFLILLCLVAIPAGVADGHTKVDSSEPAYQRWVDQATVPTPPGKVKVTNALCPYIKAPAACAKGREIYSPIPDPSQPEGSRRLFYHELGHVFRRFVVRWWSRVQLLTYVIGQPSWGAEAEEDFAELYVMCADGRVAFRPYLFYVHASAAQVALGCSMIERAFYSWPIRATRRSNRQAAR